MKTEKDILGEVDQAGIWGAEQIVPVDPFLRRLATHGLVPTIQVIEPADHRNELKSYQKKEGNKYERQL